MILNFFFDFILLLSVSILLRRNVSIYKILGGSFIGGVSILFLFIDLNSLTLFIYKFMISILMILVSFGYKSIKYTFKNILYLYTASIILGGFLYFLNVEFSYQQYVKQGLWLKNNYSNYYKVTIYYDNKKYLLNAFLDTGNNLVVPFTKKPVILVNKKIKVDKFFYIPYKGVNNQGTIKCFKADKIEINNLVKKNIIVGLLNEKIKIDGVDCLLNKKLLEG